MLHFINNQMWKALFGRQADGLEQSIEDEDEYRLLDKAPITNKYTSINCSSYVAGIIEGVLTSAKLFAVVTAHMYSENENEGSNEVVYVIKFDKEVAARERN